jgi:hypothetical protein
MNYSQEEELGKNIEADLAAKKNIKEKALKLEKRKILGRS